MQDDECAMILFLVNFLILGNHSEIEQVICPRYLRMHGTSNLFKANFRRL